MKKYVLISKENKTESHMRGHVGKSVLMSFASKPLWKEFFWIKAQKDSLPACYDLKTMQHAMKRYTNPERFEIMPYEQALKEFNRYEYVNNPKAGV